MRRIYRRPMVALSSAGDLASELYCVIIQNSHDGARMDLRDALIDWDEPDDQEGNTCHVAEHGLTSDEVDSVLFDENTTFDLSGSSGRPIAFGMTSTGRFIAV